MKMHVLNRLATFTHVVSSARACGNRRCGNLESRWCPSRRQQAILANGRWFCSPDCFEVELRREFSVAQSSKRVATARTPLGMLLLARDVLTEDELRWALKEQRPHNERFGQCVRRLGLASQFDVTSALAAQWQCPVLNKVSTAPGVTAQIPLVLLRGLQMAPAFFSERHRKLYVAYCEAVDSSALLAIERILDLRADACFVDEAVLLDLLCRAEGVPRETEVDVGRLQGPEEMAQITRNYAEEFGTGEVRYAFSSRFCWVRLSTRRGPVHLAGLRGAVKHP